MKRAPVAVIVIGLIATAGLAIALQGWRERGPDGDVLGAMVRAGALIEYGELPKHGTLTDHNSARPPGISWLMTPGVVLFDDPRLVEISATAFLYVTTLPAVYLLGRHFFNRRVALFAVGLYGFSAIAINLTGLLQPRASGFFVAWMTYCAAAWVTRRDARWLAGALLVWSGGMYVHIEMSALILMLPVVWWRYRPPVTAIPIVAAVLLSAIVWWPYLVFQADRNFVDLQSQLLSRRLEARGIETVPGCGARPAENAGFLPYPSFDAGLLTERAAAIPDLIFMNLESRVLAGEFILLGLLAAAIVIATSRVRDDGQSAPMARIAWAAGGFAVTVVTAEFALRWAVSAGGGEALMTIRRLQVWAIVIAAVWACTHRGIAGRAGALRRSWQRADEVGVLVSALVAPSLVLLLFAQAGMNRRVGLVPLEMLLIAAGVAAAVEASTSMLRRGLIVALVAMVAIANPEVLHRLRGWSAHGWSGREPAQVPGANFRLVRCDD